MRFTNLSRRSFLTATAGAAALSPLAPLRRLAAAASANTLNLGLQLYSLRNYKVDEALKHARDLGFKFVEFYSGMYPLNSDAAAIDTMKKKLADLGLTPSAHGVNRFTKDAAANRKIFAWRSTTTAPRTATTRRSTSCRRWKNTTSGSAPAPTSATTCDRASGPWR
jgi:ABC-type sugar transport system substrate-binding protein